MENVFVPYLNTKSIQQVEADPNHTKPQMLRDEFMLNLSKFVQQIKRTINQIEGRFGLEIPESIQAIQKESVQVLAQNAEIVEMLESTVSNWQNQVCRGLYAS